MEDSESSKTTQELRMSRIVDRIDQSVDRNVEGTNLVPMSSAELDDDGRPKRTGTFWTASAHAITACIGSGVLSLAWGVAQLGWIAGPLVNVSFAVITYFTSVLLVDSYRYMNPVSGRRLYTYMDTVKSYLGRKDTFVCGLVQYTNLFGICIGYTVTASATQIFFSQIPDFAQTWWLSVLAAIMSFSYSGIGLVLSLIKFFDEGQVRGTLYGWPIGNGQDEYSRAQKVWKTLSAVGDIAFAYSFIIVLLNIQDTLKSPPPENKTMKKVALASNLTCSIFYLSVGCVGYAAFGNHAPGNLLTGFGFYEPYWLIDFANACIVVHLVGAYQIFAQPLFSFLEGLVLKRWPKKTFLNNTRSVSIRVVGRIRLNIFHLVWRTIFVLVTTLLALLLPFFNSIMGLLGALAFFPLSVYFPIRIYMKRTNLRHYKLPVFHVSKGIQNIRLAASSYKDVSTLRLKCLGSLKP
ncbi:hypothetical protein AXG93_3096s1150 [Marchantia polymorpha subsp. ruderalis]|uniref:Amino acid transporter transmembrane domain-containing protein n=1 Tax=Marchantia polymorpha subsp. ruderalis TaxID=1480154 RepID=A0A176W855_MARPO|nr:hypothetical protein AXG93_3096s1150 [Marchantia polymorpha subsp. ruderalis]